MVLGISIWVYFLMIFLAPRFILRFLALLSQSNWLPLFSIRQAQPFHFYLNNWRTNFQQATCLKKPQLFSLLKKMRVAATLNLKSWLLWYHNVLSQRILAKNEYIGKFLKVDCTLVLKEIEYPSVYAFSSPVSPGISHDMIVELTISDVFKKN